MLRSSPKSRYDSQTPIQQITSPRCYHIHAQFFKRIGFVDRWCCILIWARLWVFIYNYISTLPRLHQPRFTNLPITGDQIQCKSQTVRLTITHRLSTHNDTGAGPWIVRIGPKFSFYVPEFDKITSETYQKKGDTSQHLCDSAGGDIRRRRTSIS